MKGEQSRDRSIEQLLRRSRAAEPGAPVSDSCLDAETLAAWVDGGLDTEAMAMAEAHASGCARCQAMLGVMSRSAPEAPATASWWRRDWSLRWLVPLTAGAAAVALWMIVPGSPPTSSVPERQQLPPAVAEESRVNAPAPAAPPPPAVAPPAEQPQVQATPSQRERRDASVKAVGRETAAENQLDAARRPEDRQVPSRDMQTAPKALEERVAVGALAMAPPPLCGVAWERLPTDVAGLTAGSSPSGSVCWVVGRGGVVMLSTDGRTWQRVLFPEPADLASVQAVDARTATVTATDGRTFRTADAGKTWALP